jgi:4-hydroxy-tetrahydrodipicolinate synthase
MPAIVTPFTKGGRDVDYDKACALAARLAKQNVHGIYVCGTTGEGMLMTLEERKRLVRELAEAVGEHINVVAQTGCFDTASTIELTAAAHEAGAVACGVITPGFYGYDDEALRRHFHAVAKAVPKCPILLYDLPACARNALSPALVLQLAGEIPNLVGLKESNQNMAHFSQLAAGAPKGFNLINGADEYTYQAYLTGATGTVSSTANVVPELFLGIWENVRKGDAKKAWQFQVKLQTACRLFQYGSMVAYYKEGLRLRGFDAGFVRPPQRELSPKERKVFAQAFERSGLL